MRAKKRPNKRIVFLTALMLSIFMLFGFRAVNFQVVTADEFASKNANLTAIKTSIDATRGIIVDRYGRPIAYNREGYNVVFNSAYMKKADYNKTITELTELLTAYGYEWNDILPITKDEPYQFTDEATAVSALKNKLSLNSYATAENCYNEMISRYSLEGMSTAQARTVMGIRYSMERMDFSVSNPYTFAEDISPELMIVIAESYSSLPGVEISVVSYREYTDTTLASHVVGTIGKITAEEWQTLKDSGYSYDDYVGKDGVEKAFEDYLKGEDGELTYYFDKSGNVAHTEVTKESTQGDTVFLTIDSKLQKVAQDALEKNIKELNSKGGVITGGAVTVTNVKTGEVLVCANYPNFDLDEYYSNYTAVVSQPNNPLYNRALRGTYPPGSAFKPLVAIAGLQKGVINRSTTVYCRQKYTFYEDYQPSCMHYHRDVNVISALAYSCNYFFFDVGRQVGINDLNSYSLQFGFGVSTGIELSESTGTLAGPEFSASVGKSWYDGSTLAAAIGQSDNAFTPIQMSSYTATIANGGTRYRTTLLNGVKKASSNEYTYRFEPDVLNTIDVDASVISSVKEGMHSVTSEGTASAYFADYPVAVGGKTGTAETTGADNSVLILFAPYEDPEIAISIIVEHGERSTSTGPVAKAIMDEYFFGSSESYVETKPNQLIK